MFGRARAHLVVFALLTLTAVGGCSKCNGGKQDTDNVQTTPPLNPTTWVIAEESVVRFSATKAPEQKVSGSIGGVSGTITFDPKVPTAASGVIEVELGSVITGDDERDKNIRDTFFEVAKEGFGTATFKLSGIETDATEFPQGSTITGTVKGQLLFHGRASLMAIQMTFERRDNVITATSTGGFIIQVGDWELGMAHKALAAVCGHEELSENFPVTLEFVLKGNG